MKSCTTAFRRGVSQAGGKKAALFEKTIALGRKRYENPGSLGLGEKLIDALLTRLVRRKVQAGFGGRPQGTGVRRRAA